MPAFLFQQLKKKLGQKPFGASGGDRRDFLAEAFRNFPHTDGDRRKTVKAAMVHCELSVSDYQSQRSQAKGVDYLYHVAKHILDGKGHSDIALAIYIFMHNSSIQSTYLQKLDRIFFKEIEFDDVRKKILNDANNHGEKDDGSIQEHFESAGTEPVSSGRSEKILDTPQPRPVLSTNNLHEAPSRMDDFVGRTTELQAIEKSLYHGKKRAVITQNINRINRLTISGLGGAGKTTLAVEYSHKNKYDYDLIWWCKAEQKEDLITSLYHLAQTVGIVSPNETNALIAVRSCFHWLGKQDDSILLIYDNVINPQSISDLLPPLNVSLLITSTFSDWSTWADTIDLDVWSIEEAVSFITRRVPRSDWSAAASLAETLGCLPLALDHAVAHCMRTGTTVRGYASMAMQLIDHGPGNRIHDKSVYATFDLNITAATKECMSADELMTFIGYCGPEIVPSVLIEAAFKDVKKRVQAMQALASYSLIKPTNAGDEDLVFRVHRVVQEVAKLRKPDAFRSQILKLGLALNSIFPQETYNDDKEWRKCEILLPHARTVYDARIANIEDADFSTLFDSAGLYTLSRRFILDATNFLASAIELRNAASFCDESAKARTLSNYALLLHEKSELSESIKICKQALSLRVRKFGLLNSETIISLNNLAYLYMDVSIFPRSEKLFRKSLAYTRAVFGNKDRETATSLDNLSRLLFRKGCLLEAFHFGRLGFKMRLDILGAGHIDVGFSCDTLASILIAKGRLRLAWRLLERAETIYVEKYGQDSIQNLKVRMTKSQVMTLNERLNDVYLLANETIAGLKNGLGSTHYELVEEYEKYALVLSRIGKFDDAISALENAIEISSICFSPEAPNITKFEILVTELKRAKLAGV